MAQGMSELRWENSKAWCTRTPGPEHQITTLNYTTLLFILNPFKKVKPTSKGSLQHKTSWVYLNYVDYLIHKVYCTKCTKYVESEFNYFSLKAPQHMYIFPSCSDCLHDTATAGSFSLLDGASDLLAYYRVQEGKQHFPVVGSTVTYRSRLVQQF